MFDYIDFKPKKKGYHSNVSPCTIFPQNIACVAKIDKHNEHAIYHAMQTMPLGTVAPKYYGLWEAPGYLGLSKKEKEKRMEIDGTFNYIIMEDLVHGFQKPNFVDIKLGTRASDVRTKKRSIDRLTFLVATTTSADFGFRVTDIVCNKLRSDQQKKPNRKEMAGNIYETNNFFKTFFSTHHLKVVFDELKRIRSAITFTLHQYPGFRMYASSVFIVFDGEAPENSEIRVKLIDFAHVHLDVSKDGGDPYSRLYDDGVLRGLDSMIAMIGVILSERKVQIANKNLVDPEKAYEEIEKKILKKPIKGANEKKKDKEKGKEKLADKEKSDTKSEKNTDKVKNKETQKKHKEEKDTDKAQHKEQDVANQSNKEPEDKQTESKAQPFEKENKSEHQHKETAENIETKNVEQQETDENTTNKNSATEGQNETIEKDDSIKEQNENAEKSDPEDQRNLQMSEYEKEEEEEEIEFEKIDMSDSNKDASDPENDGKIESESGEKHEIVEPDKEDEEQNKKDS